MALKTNYNDEELDVVQNIDRTYNLVDKDGNVIYENVVIKETTKFRKEGSKYGSEDVNATNTQVNQNTTDIEELKEGGGTGSGVQSVEYEEWVNYPEEKKNKGTYAVKHFPTGISVGAVNDKVNHVQTEVNELSGQLSSISHLIKFWNNEQRTLVKTLSSKAIGSESYTMQNDGVINYQMSLNTPSQVNMIFGEIYKAMYYTGNGINGFYENGIPVKKGDIITKSIQYGTANIATVNIYEFE